MIYTVYSCMNLLIFFNSAIYSRYSYLKVGVVNQIIIIRREIHFHVYPGNLKLIYFLHE